MSLQRGEMMRTIGQNILIFACTGLLGCVKVNQSQESIPSITEVASNQWRIRNQEGIGDHWNIGELEMFSDRSCQEKVGAVQEVLYSYWYDYSPKQVVYDGECNVEGHANPNTWAGGDQGEHKQVGGSWLGLQFESTQNVECVRVCQGMDRIQWVENASLEYFNGKEWVVKGSLRLQAGESYAVVEQGAVALTK